MARPKVKSGEFVPLDAEALECGGISTESIDTITIHEYVPNTSETQSESEYNSATIIIEPNKEGFRVVVTQRGLHCKEWQVVNKWDGIEAAQHYIDGGV